MDDREKEELVRSVQLRVSPDEARDVLLQIRRESYRDKKLDKHWKYEDGNVTVRSKCWLLAWCQDTRDTDIARACQKAWNDIFDKDFESVAAIVGHDFPRQRRDQRELL
jgi:hypothetical protein